jgi:hypothetical protein
MNDKRRNFSRLISESLRKYIQEMQKVELEKQLEEGYRASAKETLAVAGGVE